MIDFDKQYPEIAKFCKVTGFNVEYATIDIGKMGVGIVQKKARTWVQYWYEDSDTGHVTARDWAPEHADKEHKYLMILMGGLTKEEATAELEGWITRINKARFDWRYIQNKTPGGPPVALLVVVGSE